MEESTVTMIGRMCNMMEPLFGPWRLAAGTGPVERPQRSDRATGPVLGARWRSVRLSPPPHHPTRTYSPPPG